MHVELKETLEIPKLLKNKEYKKAGNQVADIFKMAGIGLIWIIPGGAVITTMLLKLSHKARPSAFHPNANEELDVSEKTEEETNHDF